MRFLTLEDKRVEPTRFLLSTMRTASKRMRTKSFQNNAVVFVMYLFIDSAVGNQKDNNLEGPRRQYDCSFHSLLVVERG